MITKGTPFFVYKKQENYAFNFPPTKFDRPGNHHYNDRGKDIPECFSIYSKYCPYCEKLCDCYEDKILQVAFCCRCGWWSYWDEEDLGRKEDYINYGRAILDKFDDSSLEVPILELGNYLRKNKDRLSNIHPIKCEELVASIFKQTIGNVESCSYGRKDRGIDLIVLRKQSGDKIAVQIKKHSRPIELGMIHQFCGAMIDNNFQEGMFVTTGKFRSGCFKVANNLEEKGVVNIDLVDGKRLLEFLDLFNNSSGPKNLRECVQFVETISISPTWGVHPWRERLTDSEFSEKTTPGAVSE